MSDPIGIYSTPVCYVYHFIIGAVFSNFFIFQKKVFVVDVKESLQYTYLGDEPDSVCNWLTNTPTSNRTKLKSLEDSRAVHCWGLIQIFRELFNPSLVPYVLIIPSYFYQVKDYFLKFLDFVS